LARRPSEIAGLRRRRGRLHPRELMSLEEAVRTYLGL
jgi:hypothetical protein